MAHIIFSTKKRQPFLANPSYRQELYDYLEGILKNHQCSALAIGGTADH